MRFILIFILLLITNIHKSETINTFVFVSERNALVTTNDTLALNIIYKTDYICDVGVFNGEQKIYYINIERKSLLTLLSDISEIDYKLVTTSK